MRILIAAAEAAPFAKTGGLADVTSALAKALSSRGHEVALVLPKYLMVDRAGFRTEPVDLPLLFRIDNEERTGWIHRGLLPGTHITTYFVVNDHFYNRNGIYSEGGRDYPDNLARFTFFCQSVISLLRSDEFAAQIVHCNDWQTALIPIYLKTLCRNDRELAPLKSLFTVHNLAYQGFFPRDQFQVTGLPWQVFNPDGVEFYGDLNLLKGGLIFSDFLTTVSERYAAEIMTPEYGRGMESVVYAVRNKLVGILNGADYDIWDPSVDPLIPSKYAPGDLSGKLNCKLALQAESGLPVSADSPLLANISRFDDQKGADLMHDALEILLLDGDLQFIVLGEGAPEYERLFQDLKSRFPDQVGVFIGHDEERAHRIQAGADLFLMPSRYEPCGLAQLYSLKYGTPPVVRYSGGLADTVRDYNEAQRDGYGFVFHQIETKDFIQAIRRALAVYRDKTAWNALQRRGMACDFSWTKSAQLYENLYHQILEAPI